MAVEPAQVLVYRQEPVPGLVLVFQLDMAVELARALVVERELVFVVVPN